MGAYYTVVGGNESYAVLDDGSELQHGYVPDDGIDDMDAANDSEVLSVDRSGNNENTKTEGSSSASQFVRPRGVAVLLALFSMICTNM